MEATFKMINYRTGKMEDVKKNDLPVGQIIWLNEYGQSPSCHERQAIYDKEECARMGLMYHVVNLDTFVRRKVNYYEIRPSDKLFGIGLYYNDGEMATMDEINNALKMAKIKEDRQAVEAEEKRKIINDLKARGKEIFEANRPPDAEWVIIANLNEDVSDIMTDYFSYRTLKTVILAFSNYKTDRFDEMRKAALNCDNPEVRGLADAPKNYEHREKWSMGAGYYLGKDKYSGWIIRKIRISWELEDLYITTGEGNFCAYKKVEKELPQDKMVESSNFQIVDYSTKAIALFGNTRLLKDDLKSLGGRFNAFLLHNGQKTPGWIFAKSKKDEVEQFLNQIKQ